MLTSEDRFHRRTLQVGNAQELLVPYMTAVRQEVVPLEDAYGRCLAETVLSTAPLPHFRRSGMDGFSIRSGDVRHASSDSPALLRVVENVPCGRVPSYAMAPTPSSGSK
jgi:molybdopterin molybdotransferase